MTSPRARASSTSGWLGSDTALLGFGGAGGAATGAVAAATSAADPLTLGFGLVAGAAGVAGAARTAWKDGRARKDALDVPLAYAVLASRLGSERRWWDMNR